MKWAIICDLDGTIADLSHRLHHINPVDGGKKNWPAFHASVGNDSPIEDVREILRTLANVYIKEAETFRRVFYVSGRNDISRTATEQWLREHGFPEGALFMRADRDFRDDAVIKEEILRNQLQLTPADVLCVLDDRDRVVAMWRRLGFRCLQVASGNF